MPPPHQHSRADLVQLKAHIVKRIGLERSELYFHYINRFLSLKLGKAEFEKLCTKVLGKENLRLHNQLVRAILRNTCCRKAPPASTILCGSKSLPNGDVLHLPSPRTSIGIPRNPNGMVNVSCGQAVDDDDRAIYKNRTVSIHKSMQQQQEIGKGFSLSSRSLNSGCGAFERSQVKAPIGVKFYPISSADRAGKNFPGGSYYQCTGSTGLLDSHTLRDRMQHLASAQGIDAVSVENANLLNRGLDTYLRRLMKSCFEVMGARHRSSLMVDDIHSHLTNHQTQLQNNGTPLEYKQVERSPFQVRLMDFKFSMELNPEHLGEKWPLQLEKLCSSSFNWQNN